MTLAAAHGFIRALRADDALRRRVAALGEAADLEELVAIGAGAGFAFDEATLRRAYRQGWALRWLAASKSG